MKIFFFKILFILLFCFAFLHPRNMQAETTRVNLPECARPNQTEINNLVINLLECSINSLLTALGVPPSAGRAVTRITLNAIKDRGCAMIVNALVRGQNPFSWNELISIIKAVLTEPHVVTAINQAGTSAGLRNQFSLPSRITGARNVTFTLPLGTAISRALGAYDLVNVFVDCATSFAYAMDHLGTQIGCLWVDIQNIRAQILAIHRICPFPDRYSQCLRICLPGTVRFIAHWGLANCSTLLRDAMQMAIAQQCWNRFCRDITGALVQPPPPRAPSRIGECSLNQSNVLRYVGIPINGNPHAQYADLLNEQCSTATRTPTPIIPPDTTQIAQTTPIPSPVTSPSTVVSATPFIPSPTQNVPSTPYLPPTLIPQQSISETPVFTSTPASFPSVSTYESTPFPIATKIPIDTPSPFPTYIETPIFTHTYIPE